MPFTVDTFRGKLKLGGARQNLFEVYITFPPFVITTPLTDPGILTFMCKSASLPPENLGVISVPYFGRAIKLPGDRTFPEWTISVINDETFDLRDAFEGWSNALNSHYGNLRNLQAATMGGNGLGGFAVPATILQYGKTGSVIKEYDMIGVWPSIVAPIDTGWDANDQIEEFQVTLQYQWWEARTTT